jgi:hypothetical protein
MRKLSKIVMKECTRWDDTKVAFSCFESNLWGKHVWFCCSTTRISRDSAVIFFLISNVI